MEIKHTIEILTKDIQDIEKLIRNFNNYTTPPKIELDLAMSKLRRVYELLSLISSDIKSDERLTEDQLDNTIQDIKQIIEEKDPVIVEQQQIEEESAEANIVEQPEKLDTEAITENETVPEPTAEEFNKESTEEKQVHQKEASIIAEKYASDKSLNEKIAPKLLTDTDTKIKGGPIDSIKRNIGINDRFLIIRELLNGDNEAFNQIIQKLDDCANFNEAFKHIQTRFPDNLEHEGVKILINLSNRKFISRGNV